MEKLIIDESLLDYTQESDWIIDSEIYEFIKQKATDGDGEWYEVLTRRKSDGKYFTFDWGISNSGKYNYDGIWYEVTENLPPNN